MIRNLVEPVKAPPRGVQHAGPEPAAAREIPDGPRDPRAEAVAAFAALVRSLNRGHERGAKQHRRRLARLGWHILAPARPEPRSAEAFADMVGCMGRGDYRTAAEHRATLRKLGWKIIPPASWGRGGDR